MPPAANLSLDSHSSTTVDDRIFGTSSRRVLFADGVLAAASDAANPFIPLYLVVLGATAAQVGLLASVGSLAALGALLPGAWIAHRAASRKLVVLLGAGWTGRVLLASLAAVPFVLDGRTAIAVLIAVASLRVFAATLIQPSWMAVYVDVVPTRLVGLFNARRSLAGSVTAMAVTPFLGYLVSRILGVPAFQLIFAMCAAAGLGSALCYARIVETPRTPPADEARRHGYGRVLRDGAYLRYLVALVFLHGSATIAGPFIVIYMMRNLGASPAEAGMIATGDVVAMVLGQALMSVVPWRSRARRLFIAAIPAIGLVPFLWLLIDAPWLAALPVLFGGVAWATSNLTTFHLLLEHTPPEHLPEYVAAQQVAVSGACVIGPLIGTALIAHAGMEVAFVISGLGRFGALPVVFAPAIAGYLGRLRGARPAADAPPAAATSELPA